MDFRRKRVQGFWWILALVGCTEAGPGDSGVTVIDSLGVEVVHSTRPAWDSATAWVVSENPRLSIGLVTGEEHYQFYNIADARLLPDGSILVVHSSHPPGWRIYDSTGTHLRSFGGAGEGPGESQLLFRGWLVDPDTLVGYDPLLGRITRYTITGEFLDTRPVRALNAPTAGDRDWPPVWFDRFGDGSLLGRPNNPAPYENGRTRPQFAFTHLDLSMLTYDTVLLALGPEYIARGMGGGSRREVSSVAHSPMTIAVAYDTTAFVSDTKDFWIEEVALGGRVVRRFGRSFEPEPVTLADVEEYKNRRLNSAQSEEERRYVEQLMRDQIFADTFPAHDTRMLVDALGDLWVALRSPAASRNLAWSVFDSTGVYLGAVATPKPLRITEIGDDAIVGVWRDELDIQTVKVFDLEKPPGGRQPARR